MEIVTVAGDIFNGAVLDIGDLTALINRVNTIDDGKTLCFQNLSGNGLFIQRYGQQILISTNIDDLYKIERRDCNGDSTCI